MPMSFMKKADPIMSRGNDAPLSELNPSLASVIEDTILFGRLEELQKLTEILVDHPHVPDHLRYGLEGLKYFRMHYMNSKDISPKGRQQVSQFDTSWSMHLIDMVREGADVNEAIDYEEKMA